MAATIFKTESVESFKSKLIKLGFNLFPAYRRTGGRICFLSNDWRDVHVKLKLTWKTKNYVGTVFGGSIYGAVDPIYMIQLINILGKDFVVWDKSANIYFLKPVKSAVYARFQITNEILEEIRHKINADKKYVINLPVEFLDKDGVVYAKVEKAIYIAEKGYYKNKKG
ncbi:MAG: DUF4442 domain-containing protein [Bacteroidia bacterium]|jgi:acyl-coenzyme A thioesterase PaaI-like protein